MEMVITSGDCIWFQGDSKSGLNPHYFFVLSDPILNSEAIVLCAMTSCSPEKTIDNACLLRKGDHVIVAHDSFLDYRKSKVWPQSRIEACIVDGSMRVKVSSSEELLKRMRAGARDSRYIPNAVRRLLECQGLFNWPHVP